MNHRSRLPDIANIAAQFENGLALHRQGKLAQAAHAYRSVLTQQPDHAEALHLLGTATLQMGRPQQAAELIRRALEMNPGMAPAHNDLGTALLGLHQPEQALASYDKAIQLDAGYALAYFGRGDAFRDMGRLQDAFASYQKAVARKPDFVHAHLNLGNVCKDLGLLAEAAASYAAVLKIRPEHAEAHGNLGVILHEQGRWEDAIASYEKALAINPDYADAYCNLGSVLNDIGKFEDAAAAHRRALQIRPDFAAAHNSLGAALRNLARFDEAILSCDRALAIAPDFVPAHYNKSMCLLLTGELVQGWRSYEWRKKAEIRPHGNRAFAAPLWLGEEPIRGKTLLLHAEQGLGDTIQFCRYAHVAQAQGARAILSVQDSLKRLIAMLRPAVEIVSDRQQPRDFDYHCPLLSAPLAFATTPQTIPAAIPYLRAEPERVEKWKDRLGDRGLRIGICWQGSTGKIDFGRSFPVGEFRALAGLPDVRLISLQKGAGTEQLADVGADLKIETLGDDFDSGPDAFLDSAAVIANVDLVITSDTAMAHLAGALGRPVWIALKHVPDWRWMMERADSPWYPSARLFRQTPDGDWTSVFAQIANALAVLLRERNA